MPYLQLVHMDTFTGNPSVFIVAWYSSVLKHHNLSIHMAKDILIDSHFLKYVMNILVYIFWCTYGRFY